jgi:gentisate 1,2-dioxygenase
VRRLAEAPEFAPGCRQIELGSPAMRTVALHVDRLDAGASFSLEPTTLNSIYAVMQGSGEAKIDDAAFTWKRGDVIAVPSSCRQAWKANEQSYLLQVSDEPLLKFLDWLRPVPANA